MTHVAERTELAQLHAEVTTLQKRAALFMQERNDFALELAATKRERDGLAKQVAALRAILPAYAELVEAAAECAHWPTSAALGKLEAAVARAKEQGA